MFCKINKPLLLHNTLDKSSDVTILKLVTKQSTKTDVLTYNQIPNIIGGLSSEKKYKANIN